MSEYQPDKCGFCRRRGEACVKHGGTNSQDKLRRRRGDPDGNLDKPLPETPPPFADPYNCSMCAQKESLCDMHQRFHDSKENKVNVPQPAQTPIRTTEQQVGQHRIVQIKVGEVVITIKEPIGAIS